MFRIAKNRKNVRLDYLYMKKVLNVSAVVIAVEMQIDSAVFTQGEMCACAIQCTKSWRWKRKKHTDAIRN